MTNSPYGSMKKPSKLPNYANPNVYPHNRHSEICCIKSTNHLRNSESPIAKSRLQSSPQKQNVMGSPSKGNSGKKAGSKPQQYTVTEADLMRHSNSPLGDTNKEEELHDFENFLQNSAQHSLENSNVMNGFDSFSGRKHNTNDGVDEAYRESMLLSNMLDEKINKLQKNSNIFFN